MTRLLYLFFLFAALLLLAAGAASWYLRSAEPDYGRDAAIAGLRAPVEVWRDSLGVPHIWAANEPDLMRALGYVHAQDRLWQMELFRRVADGRMAEILGSDLIPTDRFLRTLGMGRAAAENEAILDPQTRALLEAYTAGVNAWLMDHTGALPPEFVALRFEPEPWTVRNTLSISKIMAWDLADWNEGLDLQRAIDVVGTELARDLHPEYPEWGPTILHTASPPGRTRNWEVGTRNGTTYCSFRVPTSAFRLPEPAARLLEAVSIARASNSWVVGGSRTYSGRPILANDPHLALRAPSLWYLAALHGGDIEVVGATIPGTPAVILGRTPGVAWGFTNAMVDDVDFFIERIDPQDPSKYSTPDGWRAFQVRPETIRVKGQEPVIDQVRITRHGPVLSDVEDRGGDRVLAMRWSAHDPSTESRALLRMNRARTADELLAALGDFDSPHQNVIFADTSGTIGYRMTGRVPVRRSGDGLLPVPGWTGEGDWEGYLDPEEHPQVVYRPGTMGDRASREDFIVTANNRQLGSEYPHHIGNTWAEPFRAVRIRDMIEAGSGLTASDVAAQQMDVRDAFAARYLPHAIRGAAVAGESGAARRLRRWNAEARADSPAAALFYTWYEALRRRVGADEYRGEPMYFPRSAMNRILDAGGGAWVDDVRTPETETLGGLSAEAMREAVRIVGVQVWGDLHATHIDHTLGPAKLLDGTLDLNLDPFARPGSPYTVDVAGYRGTRPPFRNSYGASLRHVSDLADPDGTGLFIVPTGQSGLPFSEHYRDQVSMWREGRLWPIPLERQAAEARIVHRLTLTRDQDSGFGGQGNDTTAPSVPVVP